MMHARWVAVGYAKTDGLARGVNLCAAEQALRYH
jgi:hypothetical protein